MARMQRLPARLALLVLDSRSREPLQNARITYRNLRIQGPEVDLGVSDSTGSYIAKVPAGRYQIIVNKDGYKMKSKILNLRGEALNRFTFHLQEQQ